MEGRLSSGTLSEEAAERVDLQSLKARLSPQGVPEFFEAKSASGLEFGPAFRGLEGLWCGTGEALGEIALPDSVDSTGLEVHPLLIDGCFQVMSSARDFMRSGDTTTYMPFGWERLSLSGRLPDRIVCHARMRESSRERGPESSEPPETVTSDLWLYDRDGLPLGVFTGFTSKKATRSALLSSSANLRELLYEVTWREAPYVGSPQPADFLVSPSEAASQVKTYSEYLSEVGVSPGENVEWLADLERLSQSYALRGLERLGWKRIKGNAVAADALLDELRMQPTHRRLLGRILQMLCEAGILQEDPQGEFIVTVGADESLPNGISNNPEELAATLADKYPHGHNEIGVLRRCGSGLDDVLTGITDPLGLLFAGDGPSASNFYQDSPSYRASAQMLAEAVAATLPGLPTGRRLRVLEVGAGTGAGTAAVLPQLPAGRFDYVFTDISASFFEDAERRFGKSDANMHYRPLNIEMPPESQGFEPNEF